MFRIPMIRIPKTHLLLSLCLALALPLVAAEQQPFDQVDPAYQEKFREAVVAYEQQKFDEALAALDEAEKILPDFAETYNLRGGIYTQMRQFDQAKAAFAKALEKNPKSYPVRFNQGEVEFLEKNYAGARAQFLKLREDLRADKSKAAVSLGDLDKLVTYKIVLTYLLEGKKQEAEESIKEFTFMDNVPAYYFSKAAVAFTDGDEAGAMDFLGSADRNYRPELNRIYADSFYEIGWLNRVAPTATPAP